jgi:predicted membrane protein
MPALLIGLAVVVLGTGSALAIMKACVRATITRGLPFSTSGTMQRLSAAKLASESQRSNGSNRTRDVSTR